MDLGEFNELRVLKETGFFGVVPPVMFIIRGTDAQASINFTTPFFIADRSYEVLGCRERQEVAATDGTLDVLRIPSGTAPASGTSVLASTINLTTTADTIQTPQIAATLANRRLDRGDSLTLKANGLLTSLVGVSGSITLRAI